MIIIVPIVGRNHLDNKIQGAKQHILVVQTKEAEQKIEAGEEKEHTIAPAEKEKIGERNFLAEQEKEFFFHGMVGMVSIKIKKERAGEAKG
jgi:hypothetical protein